MLFYDYWFNVVFNRQLSSRKRLFSLIIVVQRRHETSGCIYIYICVCVCVCVCIRGAFNKFPDFIGTGI